MDIPDRRERWDMRTPHHDSNVIGMVDANDHYHRANRGTMKANLGLNEDVLSDDEQELYGEQ
jgi:hypothetical protein